MIETRLCFVAEGVIQDANTGAISVFNLIDQIAAVSVPFFIQRISFFTLWERTSEDPDRIEGHLTLTLNDTNLVTSQIFLDFSKGSKTQTIMNFAGLVVSATGLLRFHIELQDGGHSEYAITVQGPPLTADQAAPVQP